jgi:hypothetical protein
MDVWVRIGKRVELRSNGKIDSLVNSLRDLVRESGGYS